MRVGIQLIDRPHGIGAAQHFDDLRRLVDAAQDVGVSMFTLGQHFLYDETRWLQPIPTLARLSADLDIDARLVAGVIVVPAYHPVVLAEELATLDIVSEGRLVIGLGTGYRPDELAALGVPFDRRLSRMVEAIEIMKAMWAGGRVTHHGRYWDLDDVATHVHPRQKPHPELWMGGHSDGAARRAGTIADRWMIQQEMTVEEIRHGLAIVDAARAERGLDPVRQPIRRNVMVGSSHDEALERYRMQNESVFRRYAATGQGSLAGVDLDAGFAAHAAEHAIIGTGSNCAEQLRQLVADVGVGPVLLKPQSSATTLEDALEELRRLSTEVIPALLELPG